MARHIVVHDPDLGPLTRDRLTRDYFVYQRARGHRFSVDDVATAWVASDAVPAPSRVLDLGCGLGSVLLHLAWVHPGARLVGIEAQAASFELARRNVRENGVESRIELVHADLADESIAALRDARFDLVTGTPPYFPPPTATRADDMQRAYARIEYRGGVEAYVRTAARVLAPEGRLVLCGAPMAEGRVWEAAAEHGMHLVARTVVVGREGRPPLFTVWTLASVARACADRAITIRDREGRRTEDAHRLTRFSGLEPRT